MGPFVWEVSAKPMRKIAAIYPSIDNSELWMYNFSNSGTIWAALRYFLTRLRLPHEFSERNFKSVAVSELILLLIL